MPNRRLTFLDLDLDLAIAGRAMRPSGPEPLVRAGRYDAAAIMRQAVKSARSIYRQGRSGNPNP